MPNLKAKNNSIFQKSIASSCLNCVNCKSQLLGPWLTTISRPQHQGKKQY